MAKRPKIADEILAQLLLDCRRRCCVCFSLEGDSTIKPGQVAHLDGNPANNKLPNLAWLCLPHHDQYDSSTSQSKGLTLLEIERFKIELAEWAKSIRPLAQPNHAGTEVFTVRKIRRPKTAEPTPQEVSDSAQFFEQRFREAFPGVRGVAWFRDPHDIARRLKRLLRKPLTFTERGKTWESTLSPVWWWGRGNMQIESFRFLTDGRALMDIQELKISKIAAANPGNYYHCFVYIEAAADSPTGLYKSDPNDPGRYEEYGLWRGHKISRAEYDDGAAIINGKLVKLGGKAELRSRYMKPYNFIIAAQNSPVNNGHFDSILEDALDASLKSEVVVTEISAAIRKMPKPRW